MTRVGLIILTIGLLVTGCKKEPLPPGVLTKEEYASFLVDVYLAEARVSALSLPRDSAELYYLPLKEKILGKQGLSDSVVTRTYQYYIDHPQELEEVYNSVVDTLSLREQRYKGKN